MPARRFCRRVIRPSSSCRLADEMAGPKAWHPAGKCWKLKSEIRSTRLETNPKSQAPNPKQIPSTKSQTNPQRALRFGSLKFGTCLSFGASDLEFVSDFVLRISDFFVHWAGRPAYACPRPVMFRERPSLIHRHG